MCIITFSVKFFIFAYILPLVFVFHLFYLGALAFWTEQPFSLVLERVLVVGDDVDIPHPPGYYNPLESDPELVSEDDGFQGDHSCISNVSSDEDSILSLGNETTCDAPAITVSSENDNKPLEIPAELLKLHCTPDTPGPIDTKFHSTSLVHTAEASEQALGSLTGVEKVLPPLPEESKADLLSTTQHPAEDDEPELTEEEEKILEAVLCLKPPYTYPAFSWLPADSRALDHIPTFSRHNVDATVIFPVRKPKSTVPLIPQRGSATFSDGINSVVSHISVTWNKARQELKRHNRASVINSIRLFNRQEDERLPSVSERDPYDSWPWIRTAIEEDTLRCREGLRRLTSSVAEI